jgi:GNAT superfamily N-acetyltransferase
VEGFCPPAANGRAGVRDGWADTRMDEILQEMAPDRLAAAIEASHVAFFRQLGRSARVVVRSDGGQVAVTTGVPFPFLNGVMATRLTPEAVDAAIDREVGHFTADGLPFFWWVGPTTAPADLGERLRARGFSRAFEMPGMAADLDALPEAGPLPEGIAIERVADAVSLAQWNRIALAAFDFPPELEESVLAIETDLGWSPDDPYHRYLGRLDGQPVASSALYMGAGVAGIFTVGTLPEARRRGTGRAITLAPLLDARERGYRVGILSASRMGEPIYRRLGFQEYCRLAAYALATEGQDDA